MDSIVRKNVGFVGACCMLFAIGLSLAYAADNLAPLKISPDQIILKAKNKGTLQDIQGIVSALMPSGYHIADYDVTLELDGIPVVKAFEFRYCYVDSNFLASFNREIVQTYLQEIYPTGGIAVAQIKITYTAQNSEGDEQTIQLTSDTDDITVINPGR